MTEKPPTTTPPAEQPAAAAGSSLTNPTPATGPHGESDLLDWLKSQAAQGKLGGQASITITMPSGKKFSAPLKKP